MNNYEKKYKEALEKAKESLKDGTITNIAISYIESIFPELKEEIEDDRIRNWLEEHIEAMPYNSIEFKDVKRIDVLYWLEKQGESDETKAKIFLINKGYPIDANGIFPTYEEMYNIIREGLEYQCEQKPQGKSALEAINEEKVDNANKVEQKFHEGQWIIWQDKCYKVNYNGCGYELVDQNGLSTSLEYGTVDGNANLWDITKDAKDGDVLNSPSHHLIWIYRDNEHYYACVNMNYVTENVAIDGLISIPNDACPATKLQRDIFFAKMHEAGYDFDFEKKKLKRIEQKPVEWSEVDKVRLEEAIQMIESNGAWGGSLVSDWLKSLKDRALPQPKQEWSEEDEKITLSIEQVMNCASLLNIVPEKLNKINKWLKSLKQRIKE